MTIKPKALSGVIWITGLSGTGKTSLATKLATRYRDSGQLPVHLDGDDLRTIFDLSQKYDYASRLSLAKTYSRLAIMLAQQGHLVIVSTISLFHEIHTMNRKFEAYCEIYLTSNLNLLKSINNKGVYKNHDGSHSKDAVGLDIEPEIPITPHRVLSIDFTDTSSPDIEDLFEFTRSFMIAF
jgi:adenylylsulfate kinase